jgi:hypothetical protein
MKGRGDATLVPGYSVVVTTKEDLPTIRRFVDYYLAMGAQKIFLYYDDDIDTAAFDLGPRVAVRACDAAFWQEMGMERPDLVEKRQNRVSTHAKQDCETEWMLIVDTDEYVFGDVGIDAFLRTVPRDVEGIRMRTAEAVFGPGEDMDRPFGSSWFRRPIKGRHWQMAQYLYDPVVRSCMNYGLLGHAAGKHFLRVDAGGLTIKNHDSERDGRTISTPVARLLPEGRKLWLGHYDAVCYQGWMKKWRRRVSGEAVYQDVTRSPRQRQLQEFVRAEALGEAASRALFRRFYCLSRFQRACLGTSTAVFTADVMRMAEHRKVL